MLWLLVIVIVVAMILEYRSLHIPVHFVHYHIVPSKKSVEQGEEFKINTTIENATSYHIPYLLVEETIPNVMKIKRKENLNLLQSGTTWIHRNALFIKKHQRVKRSISAVIYERGVFHFKEAQLFFGDFLGIKEKERVIKQNQSIVVYPQRMDDERLSKVLSDILGEISVRSFLFADPMLVLGYRDYTGREPLRSISFPMTAKRNEMTVKEFDHTREELVDLIFDVEYKGDFEHYFDQRETTFCIVRTFCEAFEKKGISYRLITNAYYAEMDVRGVNVIQSGGSGGSSFHKILEMLGMASGASMCKTEELLHYVFRHFSQEKEFIYVAQRREQETMKKMAQIEQRYCIKVHGIYGEDYEKTYIEKIKYKEER